MINQVPTLFIGIGGIGCQIAGAISDMLNDNARDYVGFIGIDTDTNDLTERMGENHHMNYIQTSEDWNVQEYINLYPEHDKWFPEDNILRLRRMLSGAGQIRALSRLTFTASEKAGKFDLIFDEINRIRRVDGNIQTNLVVVIVGSITGGTGAGMFIELPFLIRNKIKEKCGVNKCTIRGMFVGPDITEDVQPALFMKDSVCVNGYSCLKELNAFNIHHITQNDMPDEIAHSIELENYDSKNMSPDNVPYDYLYLYEKSSNIGTIGNAKLEEIINYISNIAYCLLFTPIGPNAVSVEDNYILDSIRKNMLNRYVSAGVCRLIFPMEDAQEYVTVSLVKELVEKEWLVLDKRFEFQNKLAIERRVSDRTVTLPKRSEVYVEEFKEEAIGDRSTHLFAKYASEAYVVDNDVYTSRADRFIQTIDDMVEKMMDEEDVVKAKNACTVNEEHMKDFNRASGEVDRVWNAMRAFVRVAERLKSERPISYADRLFPLSKDAMLIQKDSSECIYGYLAKVHPIVARFLIYDLINKLTEKITELDSELVSVDLLAYKAQDFDMTEKGVQKPAEALSKIKESYNPIWNMLGIGDAFHREEEAIKTVRTKLKNVSTTHVQTVLEFLENSVKYSTFTYVLDRLKTLSDKYEKFFETIDKNIESNNNKLRDLTSFYWAFGESGVYCSENAFARMSEEFMQRQGESLVLSDDTKKAVFEELFSIQANDYAVRRVGVTESMAERNKREADNEKAMNTVFDTAIIGTVRQAVIENGANTVNLTVKEAIEREYILSASEKSLEQYINEKVNAALRIATPMITTTAAGNRNNELIFMAMSEPNASLGDNDDATKIKTVAYYMGGTSNNVGSKNYVQPLIDSEFNNQEIVFIKITYGHVIEDLIKYGPGSRNAMAYDKRIRELGKPVETTTEVEINPHLNRYWHEEGYIPSMQLSQRLEDKKNLVRAFILGIGYDCFIKIPFQDRTDVNGKRVYKWAFTIGSSLPAFIKKHGDYIGNDYIDLYNSILFNGAIKKSILSYAAKKADVFQGYNSSDMIASRIFEEEFISDLITADEINEDPADSNMFDIFLSMYSNMKPEEWKNLVVGLRDILWDIFKKYFNGDVSMINSKTKEVLDAIYWNSSLGSTNDYSESQRMLKQLYEGFLAEDYE